MTCAAERDVGHGLAMKFFDIEWCEVERFLRQLSVGQRFDSIVGVSRGGAVLGIGLSNLVPELPLHFVYKTVWYSARGAAYVKTAKRAALLARSEASLELTFGFQGERPLIIDDVAAHGDTMIIAERLAKESGAVETIPCVFAVDRTIMSRANPELLGRLTFSVDVDNTAVWVRFPWNLYDEVPSLGT